MRHLGRNIAIIAIVLFFAAISIIPPEKKLRLGKDLAGGVSLVYSVDVPPGESPDVVIPQVISVLSERINPQGLYEISFVRQGRNRLVVTMPLPSEAVQEYRQTYEDALDGLAVYTFDSSRFERAMRLSGQERLDALTAMMDSPGREQLLSPVRDAVSARDAARQSYEETEALLAAGDPDVTQDDLEVAELAAVDAEIALDRARATALSNRVSPRDMREALTRSDDGATIYPAKDSDDEPIVIPSPQERALEELGSRMEANGGTAAFQAVQDAYADYLDNRSGLDDPDDLERQLAGAGILEFRITATPSELAATIDSFREEFRESGPNSVPEEGYIWLPLNTIEDWIADTEMYREFQADPRAYFLANYGLIVEERREEGQYYALAADSTGRRLTQAEGEWALADSFPDVDQLGRRAIGFRMDARGATRLGDLTGGNIGRQMAVVLDGRIYTAPNLNGRITSRGIIQGTFSPSELSYIIKTLNAGSLTASLSDEPISRSVLAPELGRDNLLKGLEASIIALILVGIFMMVYYFASGMVAMIALTCNAIIILGAMSLNNAAFTLPGIAGIVLTFGMAVDANVLIYERIREELLAGEDPKAAVRVAYQKVLSTIVDANVTNLIVCVVLAYTASQEIKGFAITLGIGVVATMFSSLLITRVIFSLMLDKMKIAPLAQLPTAVPVIDRLLTPKINWIGLRPLFVLISLGLIGMGVFFMTVQREKMLDTEFLGGTQLDLRFKTDESGTTKTMTRAEVQERVDAIAASARERIESGSAAPARITSVDWLVRDTEGDDAGIVTRRSNAASDEDLRGAATYADVIAWLAGRGAFADRDPQAFTIEGGGSAESTDVTAGEVVLVSDPPGLRVTLTIDRSSPDQLLAELGNAEVVAVNPQADGITSERFQVKTSISDADLVQTEIVAAFENEVDSQPALSFIGVDSESRREALVFPVLTPALGANFDNDVYTNDVSAYQGGVVILAENLDPSPTLTTLRDRLEYMRRQANFSSTALGRTFEVVVLEGEDEAVQTAAILIRDEGYDASVDPDRWERFAQEEWEIARTALGEAQTLAGVESFSPEIAATFRNQAIVAVVLSFMLITMYIWARFGSVRYSLAALSCLVHDVIIAIGLIALAEIIYEYFPGAAAIGIQPFKIDLGLVAAILTIIGYSLNDTIIILDRIRENRGKLAYASKEVVNLSINQTISRTLITSTTTLLALITMFVIGGEGIASFTYALICGVIIGTYSSIAVAAPLVYTSKIPEAARTFRDRYGNRPEETTADETAP